MNTCFDVIITTYNRTDSLNNLVTQINACTLCPQRIIVVDSSDIPNPDIQQLQRVLYIRSSHKNQPYQRYLGFLASQADIIVFMDDDVKIINNDIFKILLCSINYETVGSTVKYIQDGVINIQREVGDLRNSNDRSRFLNLFWWFTGVPKLRDGKVWLAGLKGKDDKNINTESFGGPGTLSFKREIVPSLFDDLLFSLYERKMGKGEDKYISIGALKYGKLCYNDTACLIHPPNESSYYHDLTSFYRRELYSRLLLSKRYLKVKEKWIGWGYIHYYWFAFWRLIMAGIQCLLHPKAGNFQILGGKLLGVSDTVFKPYRAEDLCPDIDWAVEFEKDLRNMKTRNQQS